MRSAARPSPRRGITLVEMLVTVALVVIIMGIIVQIFQSATGAIHVSQTYQDLDMTLRRLDATIRQDLRGVTARFTPPLDPSKNLGYFEYGENMGADLQGEDGDDYLAMTVKAPEGQPFRGRITLVALPNTNAGRQGYYNTVLVTSEYAEVIYFLRDGDLYRRVLLVAPNLRGAVILGTGNLANGVGNVWGSFGGTPTFPLLTCSWQGMNDISAHPAPDYFPSGVMGRNGNLSPPVPNTLGDLTNREFRFARPRFSNDYMTVTAKGPAAGPDGVPDDFGGGPGGAPDGIPDYYQTLYFPGNSQPYYSQYAFHSPTSPARPAASHDTMAFPFIYPGMYSQAGVLWPALQNSPSGSIHLSLGTNPNGNTVFNHFPLNVGDNLGVPTAAQFQTWWGFPTFRETMSSNWIDPVMPVNYGPNGTPGQSPGLSYQNFMPLPPVSAAPPYDGAGAPAFIPDLNTGQVWRDDLIATGVRSFDVKAYDEAMRTYVDLGYGADQGVLQYIPGTNTTSAFNWLLGTPPISYINNSPVPTFQTFAHEGRVPPTTLDGVQDAQWPGLQPPGTLFGDDSTNIPRLRRVWDSWSTDYTNAPCVPIDPFLGPPYTFPAYPSFPPPYPAPLRGIQIQIRLVNDPKSDRIKVLTIRQDFTDKL